MNIINEGKDVPPTLNANVSSEPNVEDPINVSSDVKNNDN